MAKAKSKAKVADKKKKNIKEVEIEEIIEDVEEFDDEDFDFVEDDEEIVETPKKKKVSKIVEDVEDDEIELTMEERVIGIEKKQNVILIFVIITALFSLLTFITGLSDGTRTYSGDEDTTGETTGDTSDAYDTSAFTKIKAQDLESLSKKDTIIVWIGRQGCGYCSQFVPTITSVGEKLDETIYYIDLGDVFDFSTNPVTILDDEAYDLLANIATDKDNEGVMESFGSTPMTLVIKKNKVVGNFIGAYDEATVLEILEDEGFKQK